jgi:hypothetical protein
MKKIALGLLIVIAGFTWRFFLLGSIPTAIHPDEQSYSVNAQSWLVSGTSLNKTWTPWRLQPLTAMHAELPAAVTSLGYIFTNNPLIATRLPSVIMGGLLPLILAWISWGLFKNENISWGVLITTTFNPWLLQNSRFGFDPLYSLFFYCLAIACYLNLKPPLKYISFPLMILGFFQYQGYKLLFAPIIFLLILRDWQKEKFKIKKLFTIHNSLLIGLTLIFFFSYVFGLKNSSVTVRMSEKSLIGAGYLSSITQSVDGERRLSLNNKLTPIFSNKINSIALERLNNVFSAFSPTHLFLSGDAGFSGFSVWSHGYFYLLDFIFIIASLQWLLKKKNFKDNWLIYSFLLIGLIPLILNTTNRWYIFRPSFTYIMISLISGIGLAQLWKKSNLIFKTIIVGLFALSVVNFSYQYFVRYPIYSTTGNYFDHRQLASYVERARSEKTVNIYSPEAEFLFQSYLVYTNKINKQSINNIKENYIREKYSLDNVNFLHKCVPMDNLDIKNTVSVVDPYEEVCEKTKENKSSTPSAKLTHVSLANIIDSGETYKIYGDTVCNAQDLGVFIHTKSLKHFNLKELDNKEYCQEWISNVTKLEKR